MNLTDGFLCFLLGYNDPPQGWCSWSTTLDFEPGVGAKNPLYSETSRFRVWNSSSIILCHSWYLLILSLVLELGNYGIFCHTLSLYSLPEAHLVTSEDTVLRRSKLSDLATSRWANPKMSEGRVCHGRPLKSVGELMGISWEVMWSFGFSVFCQKKTKQYIRVPGFWSSNVSWGMIKPLEKEDRCRRVRPLRGWKRLSRLPEMCDRCPRHLRSGSADQELRSLKCLFPSPVRIQRRHPIKM